MDLETRKLNLITYLAQLQDESFFEKIENYLCSSIQKMYSIFEFELIN